MKITKTGLRHFIKVRLAKLEQGEDYVTPLRFKPDKLKSSVSYMINIERRFAKEKVVSVSLQSSGYTRVRDLVYVNIDTKKYQIHIWADCDNGSESESDEYMCEYREQLEALGVDEREDEWYSCAFETPNDSLVNETLRFMTHIKQLRKCPMKSCNKPFIFNVSPENVCASCAIGLEDGDVLQEECCICYDKEYRAGMRKCHGCTAWTCFSCGENISKCPVCRRGVKRSA